MFHTKWRKVYSKTKILSLFTGNGPSGITLSYMLAGNWPYWQADRIETHPDELLRARLIFNDSDKSLVEQNLFELADGLEGRSTNPVSLLLDSLTHPGADVGMELPNMLEYKKVPGKEVIKKTIKYAITYFLNIYLRVLWLWESKNAKIPWSFWLRRAG